MPMTIAPIIALPNILATRMIQSDILARIAQTLETRKSADPTSSYTASLLHKGLEAILKKIGEETIETVMAAKDGDRLHIVREVADLWFHTLVLLAQQDLGPEDVLAELARREGISGIDEKLSRLTD
jgi:phosphoribosyl-ATP pyrophosphohydrolase